MRVRVRVCSPGTFVPKSSARRFAPLAFAVTLGLTGCAHEPGTGRASAPRPGDPPTSLVREIQRTATGEGTTCVRETPIGSRVPRPVCRSAQERQRQRDRSDGLLEDLRRARTGQ
jgi:hypothetical protein